MLIAQFKTSAGRGGAEKLLLTLTEELEHHGHHVSTFIAEKGWLVNQMERAGFRAHVFSFQPMQLPRNAWQIYRQISQGDFDVILSHGARVNLISAFVSVLTGVPLITVEHNIDDWRKKGGFRLFIDRFIGMVSVRRVAVSHAVAEMLVKSRIIRPDKITVITNGIRYPLRLSLSLSGTEWIGPKGQAAVVPFSIVTVARLEPQKGHAFIIKAMREVVSVFPSARAYLIGEGTLRNDLMELSADLGICKSIIFLGRKDNVEELLPSFEIFVLPSLWEGLPLALLEAMGLGLPVIATAVAGVPEVVTNGINGLLVPPGNEKALAAAIIEMMGNSTLRARLAESGCRHVRENYDFARMVGQYERLLLSEARRS